MRACACALFDRMTNIVTHHCRNTEFILENEICNNTEVVIKAALSCCCLLIFLSNQMLIECPGISPHLKHGGYARLIYLIFFVCEILITLYVFV